ncbi:T9SS type A sorting domain-containing protein [Rubricoccus marinus]|uniref:Secretion system C-terminal sorting domain-containing protein n=1 Tax=Rubricoccus marinus TaxID=716817 RepID=A0A259TVL0_9BACT|nr:T9SS type A sorting domain-containing protein [Rubricoccus marinus]OZC01799.1 hypothetical protein BSZ36_01625 [Rubricoccus marinus]
MFTYTGQDAPVTETYALDPNGQAKAAQTLFLNDLDPETISFFDFEDETPNSTDATPGRSATAGLTLNATARFNAYGDNGQIPALVRGRNGAIVRLNTSTNRIGTFATSGNQYLYAVGYDGSNPSVPASIPDGTTQTALALEYAPGSAEAGRMAKPFSAFGAYVNDTEAYGTIRLTLTPLGGATAQDPLVIVDYDGIINQGNTGLTPGNSQVTFIGFADFDSQYERIDISFTNRKAPAPGRVVEDNEAFGFDDFVVGELNQVFVPNEVIETRRVLDQVDEPGWRLLSAPVRGVTVADLAAQNLVQGVPAGDGTPAQYPEAGSNFYWEYGGGTRWDYIPVPSTSTVLRPGRGFWWYWYDLELTPDPTGAGGGTSASVELDNFQLMGNGPALRGTFSESFDDNTDCASNAAICPLGRERNGAPPPSVELPTGTQTPRENFTPADDDYYMVGNPFPFPMDFSAITATGGTLAAQGVIWNPDTQSETFPRTGEDIAFDGPGSYEMVFADPPTGEQGAVAVWNGILVEVAKNPVAGDILGEPVVFTFDPVVAATEEQPLFHGKDGTPEASAEAYIRFGLFGETLSGAKTRDEIAYLRFTEGATFGWDPTDASKPAWPGGPVGLVALEGYRDGAPAAHAVMALPPRAASRRTPLSLKLSEPGTYELVWRSEGLGGNLYDLITGEAVWLSAGRYTFTSDGTGEEWERRFILRTAARSNQSYSKEEAGAEEAYVGMPSPNPTRGAFTLDVQTEGEATVSVFDALGRRVSEMTLRDSEAGQSVRVSTDGFAPGAYLVVVEAPDVRETRRVTVLR